MATLAQGTHSTADIYTREIDLTSSVKSLGVTTLGLVGETLIGPAFQPIPITDWSTFNNYFGGTNTEKYDNGYPRYELPYIAKSYLTESSQLYVTRVLGLSGFKYDGFWCLYNNDTTSGTTIGASIDPNTVIATLRSKSQYLGEELTPYVTGMTIQSGASITGTSVDFQIVAQINSGTTETYTVSLDSTKKDYILKVLGNTPDGSSNAKIFVEEMFEVALNGLNDPNKTTGFYSGTTIQMSNIDNGHNNYSSTYTGAKTPWFVSEVKGEHIIQLFRFVTISDGENANNMFKISITNVDVNALTFNVQVRSINDTDANPVIYESFNNCSLDPLSGNSYIGAQIGTLDTVYNTNSKYVIVDIDDNPLVAQSIPMGFTGYEVKNITGYTPSKIIYNCEYNDAVKNKKQYFGLSDLSGVDLDFFKFNGIDANSLSMTDGFHMESSAADITEITGIGNIKFQTIYTGETEDTVDSDITLMKYTAFFYGGFDGWDVFRANRTTGNAYQYNQYNRVHPDQIGTGLQFTKFIGTDLDPTLGIPNITDAFGITSDFYAFWSAIRTFSNPELASINVFSTPGIDTINNSILVNETIDMIENERKDSIYIVNTPDKPLGTYDDSKSSMYSVNDLISAFSDTGIDSSYSATYFPWIQYFDQDNAQYLYLSPTKDVVTNLALTDNTAYAWFAPAGMSRGQLNCVKAKKNLILDELDLLANAQINALRTFSIEGVRVWGQNTLQIADTQLNKIGVRRMMLFLRTSIRSGNLPLIFEPNDNTTKNQFLAIVTPILDGVKSGRGISDYKIIVDNGPEATALHQMNVKIAIKPIGALEFINIDFMITDEGFDFSSL